MGKSRNSEHYDDHKARKRSASKFDKLEILGGMNPPEVVEMLVDAVVKGTNIQKDHNEHKKQKA